MASVENKGGAAALETPLSAPITPTGTNIDHPLTQPSLLSVVDRFQSPGIYTPEFASHKDASLHSYPSSVLYTQVRLVDSGDGNTESITRYHTEDLEGALGGTSKEHLASKRPCGHPVWPGRHSLVGKPWPGCKKRNWNPLKHVEPRKKIWVKVLVALIIIAIAVGIGVGISKAVGGGVWTGPHTQGSIGDKQTR